MSDRMRFLPVSRADMEERGIDQLDFVYVIGDAYVDHPSFGPAIISRLLESQWLSGGDYCPAGFPSCGKYHGTGRATAWVSCQRR